MTDTGFFWTVPPDEVHVISAFGGKPTADRQRTGILGTGIYTATWQFFPLGAKLERSYTVGEYDVNLFRHDNSTNGEFAELELDDVVLTAFVTVFAQTGISARFQADRVDLLAFYRNFFKAVDQDPLEACERILNPFIKEVLQRYAYETTEVTENKVVVSKMGPTELIAQLGLTRNAQGILIADQSSEYFTRADALIKQLDDKGIVLKSISVDDIGLPDEVTQSKNLILANKAQAEADLAAAEGRQKVIEQLNSNLRLEASGLIIAIQEASTQSGGTITEAQLWDLYAKYPVIKETLGQQAKVIFSGGGNENGLANQILSALESAD